MHKSHEKNELPVQLHLIFILACFPVHLAAILSSVFFFFSFSQFMLAFIFFHSFLVFLTEQKQSHKGRLMYS